MEEIEIGHQDPCDPVSEFPTSLNLNELVADKAKVEIAIGAAGFRHLFYFLPCVLLAVIANAIFRPIPFLEKRPHLQVIEHGFAEGINAAEQREIRMAGGRNHTVKHHPLAAFAEIVFQFHNQGHVSSQINAR
jgi:hypothetical protein